MISFSRPSLDADKSETAPLFPSNAPSANISPTAPAHHTSTLNRTLLHHQQAHGVGIGPSSTLGPRSNGTANGLRSGFASYNHHQHKTNTIQGGVAGNGGKSSPSPPPHYDVVVHGTRHGFY